MEATIMYVKDVYASGLLKQVPIGKKKKPKILCVVKAKAFMAEAKQQVNLMMISNILYHFAFLDERTSSSSTCTGYANEWIVARELNA